jgi:hypothetical protein
MLRFVLENPGGNSANFREIGRMRCRADFNSKKNRSKERGKKKKLSPQTGNTPFTAENLVKRKERK